MYSYKDVSTTLEGLEEVRVRFSVSKPNGRSMSVKKTQDAIDKVADMITGYKDLSEENKMLMEAMSMNILGLEEALRNEREKNACLAEDNSQYRALLRKAIAKSTSKNRAILILALMYGVTCFIFALL